MTADTETLETRKRQFVRGEIWDAAIDLFAEKGFEETTVDEIARAAGVSRRSFFRYFASKNDLMAQGMVTYGTFLTEAISRCPPGSAPLEVLRQTVLEVATLAAAQPRARKLIQIADRYPAAREAQLSRMGEVENRVAEAYAPRCKAGPGDPMPRLLAGVTLSVLDVTFRLWFEGDEGDISVAGEKAVATLADIVCRGAGRPG